MRGPKGRRILWVRAVRRERSVRWVISIVVAVGLGESMSGRGVAGWDSRGLVSVWMYSFSFMVIEVVEVVWFMSVYPGGGLLICSRCYLMVEFGQDPGEEESPSP
jgi:hypothetical protein